MKGVTCLDSKTGTPGQEAGRKVGFFPVRDGENGLVTAIAVSPDGQTLAVSDDLEIKLFDLENMK